MLSVLSPVPKELALASLKYHYLSGPQSQDKNKYPLLSAPPPNSGSLLTLLIPPSGSV